MTEGRSDLSHHPSIHLFRFNGIERADFNTIKTTTADVGIDTGDLGVENQFVL
jgi:hypothetical protein